MSDKYPSMTLLEAVEVVLSTAVPISGDKAKLRNISEHNYQMLAEVFRREKKNNNRYGGGKVT